MKQQLNDAITTLKVVHCSTPVSLFFTTTAEQ
jgi:hypothetical protein